MSDMSDDLRGRALKGIGWVAIEKWGVRLVALGVFVILTRTVSPEAFGLISITSVVTTLLLVFVDAGFQKALIQRRTLNPLDATTAFWTSLGIGVGLYILAYVASPLVAAVYRMPDLTAVLRVLALTLVVNALAGVPAALLERDMAFRALAMRNIVGTIVGGAVAVPLALLKFGVWALVAQSLVTAVTAAIALWATTRWRPQLRYSAQALRDLWRFGVSVLGIELLNKVQDNLDKMIIGVVFGDAVLGLYYVAQRLILIVADLITTVIGKIALTTFSRLQDDKDRLSRGFIQMTFASAIVAVPVFGVIAVFSEVLIRFLSGDQWVQAVPVMQVLAVAAALAAILYFDKNTLLAVGQSRRALMLAVVEGVLTVALIVIALPWGILAVAAVRLLRLLLLWPYRQVLLKKYVSVRILPYLRNVAVAVAAFLVPLAVVWIASFTGWSRVEPVLWAFALPLAMIMFIVYYVTVWFGCGAENRTVIRRTARKLRG